MFDLDETHARALQAFLLGWFATSSRPMDSVRHIIEGGYVGREELAEAFEALAETTDTEPLLDGDRL